MVELKFRILNSTVGEHLVEFEHEGDIAHKRVRTTHVDLEPLVEGGKTFSFELPGDQNDDFPEGVEMTMTLTVAAPAKGKSDILELGA